MQPFFWYLLHLALQRGIDPDIARVRHTDIRQLGPFRSAGPVIKRTLVVIAFRGFAGGDQFRS